MFWHSARHAHACLCAVWHILYLRVVGASHLRKLVQKPLLELLVAMATTGGGHRLPCRISLSLQSVTAQVTASGSVSARCPAEAPLSRNLANLGHNINPGIQ